MKQENMHKKRRESVQIKKIIIKKKKINFLTYLLDS